MNHMCENELIQWGTQVGTEIRPPVFISLKGPLGSGKSVLARSIALGMGVEGTVASPTFNLLLTYPSPRGFQFVHLDLYRLDGPEDLWELGWEELGDRDMIVKSGCPPDYFMEEGQVWGHPIYNWESHKKEKYKWWI